MNKNNPLERIQDDTITPLAELETKFDKINDILERFDKDSLYEIYSRDEKEEEYKIIERKLKIRTIIDKIEKKVLSTQKLKQFKKGDSVVMHSCHEASLEQYKGKIWECLTDSTTDKGGTETVFLRGFSGAFFCEYLHFVNPNI